MPVFNYIENEVMRAAVLEPGEWTTLSLSRELNRKYKYIQNIRTRLSQAGYLRKHVHKIAASEKGKLVWMQYGE